MADAEEEDMNKSLVRTSTVAKINQFMQDHMIGKNDDLDIVTFIFAAQAIKPGAQQEELMNIFAEAEDDDATDTATKMHNLLKRVSVVDASVGLASSPVGMGLVEGLIDDDAGEAPVFSHPPARGSVDSEADEMPVGRGRTKSLMEQAEIDATESMARTAEKLDIAAEMIHMGHSAETVASVTGLEIGSINAIVNAAQFSPRKVKQLSQDQISDLIRLCNDGPGAVASESELAHTLLVAMKDQILSMAGANKEMMSFETTMTNELSMTHEGSMREEVSAEPGEVGGELPKSLGDGSAEGNVSLSPKYVLDFTEKPLGMSWNQTSDGKNLYVQDVLEGGLAQRLGVLVGSVIDSFNGDCVFGKGPEQIYQKFKSCALPIKIGFRRPVASSASDPNVIMLKEVTGLETETVIKLLHKFGGNVQAANEAFYIAKARTRQWISKQKVQKADEAAESEGEPVKKGKDGKSKKGRRWWKKWTKNVKNSKK